MHKAADPSSSLPPAGGAMLIGDIHKVFLDAGSVDRYPWVVQANILDGIDAAVKGRFEVVGVVIEGTTGQLGAALRALRKGTTARIVLLAQMHEEPIARRLAAAGPDEEKLADAYLICPARLASFFRVVRPLAAGEELRGNQEQAGPDAAGVRPGMSAPIPLATEISAELEQRIRHLEWLALTDELTGLKNRRYLWEFARQILQQAGPAHRHVTVLVFDIDNFKQYNDLYGHAAGDEVLRQAGLLMRRCCRAHDVVSRIGGDEFAVIFWDEPHLPTGAIEQERRSPATEHPREVIAVAKRFQKEFGDADLALLGPHAQGLLTISGGLATFPRDGTMVEQLFAQADQALLDAKRSGKNRIYLVGQPQSDIADIEENR